LTGCQQLGTGCQQLGTGCQSWAGARIIDRVSTARNRCQHLRTGCQLGTGARIIDRVSTARDRVSRAQVEGVNVSGHGVSIRTGCPHDPGCQQLGTGCQQLRGQGVIGSGQGSRTARAMGVYCSGQGVNSSGQGVGNSSATGCPHSRQGVNSSGTGCQGVGSGCRAARDSVPV